MKRYLALAIIPLAVLVLSGCGNKKPIEPQTIGQTQQQTQEKQPTQQDQGEALPNEPKAAVDKELSDVDSQINATTEDIDSSELSNTQFGL